jgi:hypothetical protein
MGDREDRVREIAHRMWEEEGRPPDQEKRHWEEAERVVEAQDRAPTGAREPLFSRPGAEQREAPLSQNPAEGAKQRVARKAPAKRAAKRPAT